MRFIRPRLSRHLAFVAVLVIAFAATACGGADADVESDPEGALRTAVEAVGGWEGIALQISLQADDAAQDAMAAEDDLSDEDIDLLLGSSIGVLATGGEGEGAVAFDVTVGGSQVAAVQIHSELALYLRLDVEEIAALVDDPQFGMALTEMLGMADELGIGAAADSLAGGDWIRLEGLMQAASLFGGMAGVDDPEADDEEGERLAEQVAAATLAFLDEDVDVAHVGSDDAGERVRATTDGAALRSYFADLGDLLASSDLAEGFVPGMVEEDLDDIPDEPISLDVWIDGGELSQIALDLSSFADDLDGELLVVVAMEEHTGGLEPPSDATAIDVFEIIGQFMGGFGGDLGGDFGDLDGSEDDSSEDDGIEDEGIEGDGGSEDDGGEDTGQIGGELPEAELDALLQELVAEGDCIPEEELDLLESFLGPEASEAIHSLIDSGAVETC